MTIRTAQQNEALSVDLAQIIIKHKLPHVLFITYDHKDKDGALEMVSSVPDAEVIQMILMLATLKGLDVKSASAVNTRTGEVHSSSISKES